MGVRTVLEVRNEIGVNNKLLNHFIVTFDLNIKMPKYLFKTDIYDLRDYYEVKDEFYKMLFSLKSELKFYSKDYYAWKTPLYISRITGIEEEIVLEYLNENFSSFFLKSYYYNSEQNRMISDYYNIRFFEKGIVNSKSEIKEISSFRILKEIQLRSRWKSLRVNI